MTLLFAYGSLKEGFPNASVNTGRRLPGQYRTMQRLPFYLVGDGHLPCLVLAPGNGEQVIGQLFEVTEADLAAMDRLERVGKPGGYLRVRIAVQRTDAPGQHVVDADVYVQHPSKLDGEGPRIGPLAEYTIEHARRLAW
ncbi:MAG: gamma-glutamylcyclotransferase [Aquincola sp.]|nr:gamma-glutamylcyclotransferase [Aquincola sp.]MDH5328917.1 gamma-glutamylcyclotransferase [Aquincola sp.]